MFEAYLITTLIQPESSGRNLCDVVKNCRTDTLENFVEDLLAGIR